MLTREERELQNAARSQMSASERADFDALSEEEQKEALNVALNAAQEEINTPKSRLQELREMSFSDFMRENNTAGLLPIPLFLLNKLAGSKVGCMILIALAVAVAIFVWNTMNG